MARSLLTHPPVRQALVIGLGVFAVALVFGRLIYGGGNTATTRRQPAWRLHIKQRIHQHPYPNPGTARNAGSVPRHG